MAKKKHEPNIRYWVVILDKMKEAELSKADAARTIGVDRKTLDRWLDGSTPMPTYAAVILSDMLNCTLDELTGREVPEEPTGSALIAAIYDDLNDDGKNSLEEYALMCRLNPRFRKVEK